MKYFFLGLLRLTLVSFILISSNSIVAGNLVSHSDSIRLLLKGAFNETDVVVINFTMGGSKKIEVNSLFLLYGYNGFTYLPNIDSFCKIVSVEINEIKYVVRVRLKKDNEIHFLNNKVGVLRRRKILFLL
jgi:hypothetical protein